MSLIWTIWSSKKRSQVTQRSTGPSPKWWAFQSSRKSEGSGFIYALKGWSISHIYFSFYTHDKNLFRMHSRLPPFKLIYQAFHWIPCSKFICFFSEQVWKVFFKNLKQYFSSSKNILILFSRAYVFNLFKDKM